MKYYRVGNRTDELSVYATADKPDAAVKLVEDLTGPIAPQQLRVTEISKDDIPEDEVILGESTVETVEE